MKIADDIKTQCSGKLHAVVATHRHKDHVSGFATTGDAPGRIIASCHPDLVLQPWTEDPEAQPDATAPAAVAAPASATAGLAGAEDSPKAFDRAGPASAIAGLAGAGDGPKAFVRALLDMHAVAESVLAEAPRLEGLLESADGSEEDGEDGEADADGEPTEAPAAGTAAAPRRRRPLWKQLEFLGDDNLPNSSAMESLATMGKRHAYLYSGCKSGLERLLPGVKVHVLGPPTVEQTAGILSQRQRDESEFWHLQAQASRLAASPGAQRLFPNAPILQSRERPKWSRWLLPRLRTIRAEQLREIVRIVDKALNNTSVILLFDTGNTSCCFRETRRSKTGSMRSNNRAIAGFSRASLSTRSDTTAA